MQNKMITKTLIKFEIIVTIMTVIIHNNHSNNYEQILLSFVSMAAGSLKNTLMQFLSDEDDVLVSAIRLTSGVQGL